MTAVPTTAPYAELLGALRRLDALLARAVAAADEALGPDASSDPWRGLYVDRAEIERILAVEPGAPLLVSSGDDELSPLGWLGARFGLSPFDLDAIALAVAPEVDLRYERLYAYLQDDVTRRRPTVDLALGLLAPTPEGKLELRARFEAEAPLVRYGLVRLDERRGETGTPVLARTLLLDESVVRALLGIWTLDPRLASFAELVVLPRDCQECGPAPEIALGAHARSEPLVLAFEGPPGAGKRRAGEAVAARVGAQLVMVDVARALERSDSFDEALRRTLRETRLRGAVLLLNGIDALLEPERAAQRRAIADLLAGHDGIAVLTGTSPWPLARTASERPLRNLVQLRFAVPDAARRRAEWTKALGRRGTTIAREDVDSLAARFRLTQGQIEDAVAAAHAPSAHPAAPAAADLAAAARAQADQGLGAVARKLPPTFGWDDIVLPVDRLEQLREICDHVRLRPVVHDEWGFDRRLGLGRGLNVLFSGPSGTGKTMAAQILGRELGLDIYLLDLSRILSKWVGGTEKNLARVFAEAESGNAILFFDEADALFGKRTEIRDSHDRYANVEVSYLLQKLEEHEGVVVLATNLRKNMDEAFVRRMQFTVEFAFPSEADRLRIWTAIWPGETPVSPDLDLAVLAARFELAGGNIRNIALAAAFLGAADGRVVTTEHVLRAIRREYQKMGKVLAPTDLALEPEPS